jgi:glycosyltransferase involved in cell wall biosynthesis
MRLSIIIAYHGEGKEFILKTIDSIETTIDVKYEIIVVDDFSDIPLQIDGVKVIRHIENKGVGACFDSGVKVAKGNFIFLMGCDVRFLPNEWASKMVSEIIKHPRALICTSVVANHEHLPEELINIFLGILGRRGIELDIDLTRKNLINNLSPEQLFFISREIRLYRGASLLLFMDQNDRPDRPPTFKNILEAQWLAMENKAMRFLSKPDGARIGGNREEEFKKFMKDKYNVSVSELESYSIPCILGAAYGTTKKWYKHIDGFWGHKKWGTLEPYISLKCLLFGGECRVAPQIETTHIFNPDGPSDRSVMHISYNKLLVAWLLFPFSMARQLIAWLPPSEQLDKAKDLIDDNWLKIEKKRNEYRKKIKVPMDEIITKFKLH